MCGIVGHIARHPGGKNSIDVVLEGLSRLEYRGYDSAGICFKNDHGELLLYKKAGKLKNLKKVLADQTAVSYSCIGHTRWATHGEVNDKNAHPHLTDSISIDDHNSLSIVHNGIIENSIQLREELTQKGFVFHSDTDSEVFLGLMVQEMNDNHTFIESMINAFKRVKGNNAFVAQLKGRQEILAIKRGAPLVCGTDENSVESFVSSDPYALAGMANKIYFPEDDILCLLDTYEVPQIRFFELTGEESNRVTLRNQEMTVQISQKGEFEHFMLKEIYEQPELINSLASFYTSGQGKESLLGAVEIKPERAHIVACGTAWHAGLLIKDYLEKKSGVFCNVELASEFRYRNPLTSPEDLGIFISQSGETADTLAAHSLCKQRGMKTLSIVNTEGSTLYRDCDKNLLIKADAEIGVASTKAFTLQSLTGWLLATTVSGKKSDELVIERFGILSERIEELLANVSVIKNVAEAIFGYNGFIFTGRGQYFPIALEGALKLKEITYVHAEGYAAGELKHGPIALIDENMVNIAITGPELYDKMFSNIQEVRARKGVIVSLGPLHDLDLKGISDHYIPIHFEGLEELAPLLANVATQLLAYYMARFKGTDIDKPRNLAKSVTVE